MEKRKISTKSMIMGIALAVLLAMTSVLFIACGDKKDSYGFDANVIYCDNCEILKEGVVMNRSSVEDGENSGGSTYFKESDKNLDWDGGKKVLSFRLDISALDNNEYTAWVLSFNKEVDKVYSHITEIRFGIAKVEEALIINTLSGIDHNSTVNVLNAIKKNGSEIKLDNFVHVKITLEYNKDAKTLNYTYNINEYSYSAESLVSADIVGLRSLWNASTNKDGVIISNLKFKK